MMLNFLNMLKSYSDGFFYGIELMFVALLFPVLLLLCVFLMPFYGLYKIIKFFTNG